MTIIRRWINLLYLVTVVLCGVIEQAKEDRFVRSAGHLEEAVEDCLVDGEEVPENTLLEVHETFQNGWKKLGSAKRKRCPR